MTDVFSDAEERYRAACERRAAVIAAWRKEGSPLVTRGSMGQPVDHPLVKQMNDLDRLCNLLGEAVSKRAPGRSPVATVAASVGTSPAAKLRAVQ